MNSDIPLNPAKVLEVFWLNVSTTVEVDAHVIVNVAAPTDT
jgi:hypothetical protein